MEIFGAFLDNPIAQGFGFLAMFIGFFGYTTTSDVKTVKIFSAANVIWCTHFFLMGNFGALGASMISLARLLLSLKYRRNMKVLLGVVLVTIIFGVFTYDGNIISILPLIATAVSSYGYFFMEKIGLRFMLGFVSICWLIYHLGTGSIAGLTNEIVMLITLGFTIYQFKYGTEKESFLKKRIRKFLNKKPTRLDFGRFIYLRDKDRFK